MTCEVIHASPQAECLVTINCTKCNESSYTFSGSIQLTISPAHSGYYLVTVQAIRSDNNEPLEDYNITQILQIPEISKPSVDNTKTDNTKTEDSEDDDPIWIYIVIAIAVLIVIVVGISILLIIYYYIMKKRSERIYLLIICILCTYMIGAHPLGYDDDDEDDDNEIKR